MHTTLEIFIRWSLASNQSRSGTFEIQNGRILSACPLRECVKVDGSRVEISGGDAVVKILMEMSADRYGKDATILKWNADRESFSFLPVTLSVEGTIQVPDYQVAIGFSLNSVMELAAMETSAKYSLSLNTLPRGREINWETWSNRNRKTEVPTILGLSRDQRVFQVELNSDDPDSIQVKALRDLTVPTVAYSLGQAAAAGGRSERKLEAGFLPILHWRQEQDGLVVEEVAFVSFADRRLENGELEGTPFPISHLYSVLNTLPPGRREGAEEAAYTWSPRGEVALFLRTCMTNHTTVPLLAVQRLPRAHYIHRPAGKDVFASEKVLLDKHVSLDKDGVAWTEGTPFSMHRLNGVPPSSAQPCILLAPGESLTIESLLSHRIDGLSESVRANGWNWEEKISEVRGFWQEKLRAAAFITLPEARLENFLKAGLNHLDVVTFGEEKKGPLLAKVGVYSAIASESLPIVEFYDSMGLHETAQRCINAFFDYQHPNGRINLYSYYDIETGAALFMAGRHFAYTQDRDWVKSRVGSLKAAANYLLSLRQLDNPEMPGHGLVAGTCADPIEPESAFMLNAYNAAGLEALAILLEVIGDPEATRYRAFSDDYRLCLRSALEKSFANGPLIPTAPHRWVPTCASSAEGRGLQFMVLNGKETFTHRSYRAFDALIGPVWAIYTGAIDPCEPLSDWLLEVNSRQMNRSAIAESQPYYSRHPEIHLLRGEREAFLNAFYSGLTSIADGETFGFWEHIHKVSAHKTHEEGWALMQLRRMLWLEAGDELRLLPGIPEHWLDAGKVVEVKGGGSYFGKISFRVERSEDGRTMGIHWDPDFHTIPSSVRLHLPGLASLFSKEASLQVLELEVVEIINAGASLSAILDIS